VTVVRLDESRERLLRELAPQALAAVVRRYRDFAAAEDAVQEALTAAAAQWPSAGVPENPRGWLIQVANRRMTDFVRSEVARRRRETEVAEERGYVAHLESTEALRGEDDTLLLFFMCCHQSLTPASAIGLTLRALGGLTAAEIARAFLTPEATMAQRISRAKAAIKESGAEFRMPAPEERDERLRAVMHVLYLMFNEGYTASGGEEFQRPELAAEAIRLTRALRQSAGENAEVMGLLALMLLTDARRAARTGAAGEMIPLTDQDRTLWDKAQIEEGAALVTAALKKGSVGPYQLQAAIAAVHDEAASVAETDWPQVLALYEVLKRISPGPMASLNSAVAAAMVHGPAAGLKQIAEIEGDGHWKQNHRLEAVRAHLLERAGEEEQAREAYRKAAAGTNSMPERNYLLMQAARLENCGAPLVEKEPG
jgi:RNA polymerase sigma factor (sigma-70 family)